MVDRMLALLAPWNCVLCRQPAVAMDLCIGCLNDLPWLTAACGRCARPLPVAGTCGTCLGARPGRQPLTACLAAVAYEYPVTCLVGDLKYRRRRVNARVLAELLAIRVREAEVAGQLRIPDLLVPVPLHPWRRMQRRFNQAELIAARLAAETGLPATARAVRRVRYTPAQTGLSRRIRRENLRGAFAAVESVNGQHVAVIDDVMTTGTTLFAVARALRAAGAASVQGWIVARA